MVRDGHVAIGGKKAALGERRRGLPVGLGLAVARRPIVRLKTWTVEK